MLKVPKEVALHLIGPSKVKKETIKKIINCTVAEYVQKVSIIPKLFECKCEIIGYASLRIFYVRFSFTWCNSRVVSLVYLLGDKKQLNQHLIIYITF